MKVERIDKSLVIGLVIVGLGAGLRAHGLGWGLPQVYEDAVPLKRAWMMWGWGPLDRFDLNPHFFNYPTLYFYIQWLGQAVLYPVLAAGGAVRSVADYQLLYILDKTPFYLMGRGITAVFGSATILVVYLLGMRVGGFFVAVPAALLLAMNTAHVAHSQMVSVDVPLTFFVTLALYHCLKPGRGTGRYTWAGLNLGLAASIKYPGALLAVPIAVAHFLQDGKDGARIRRLRPLVLCLLLGAAAFFVTSPFIVLDFQKFWADLSYERSHMEAGHFGSTEIPTWLFYLRSFGGRALGWPALALGVLGVVYLAGYRRRRWALVLSSFLVPYIVMIDLWNMKAERYLLPAVPLFLLLATAAAKEILDRGGLPHTRSVRTAAGLCLFLALAALPLSAYPGHLNRLRPDTRTEARTLIEEKVPSGGFIVSEFLGPELFGPLDYWPLSTELKERIRDSRERIPYFAFLKIPMFQARPENSAVFYDLSLYREVDLVVISGGVRDRYLKDPERFSKQVAFYRDLDTKFRKILVLPPENMTGPEIVMYKNPRYEKPFAYRDTPPESPRLRPAEVNGKEGGFYYAMGLCYESFGYPQQGLECYLQGLDQPLTVRELPLNLTFGAVRCYLALERVGDAYEFMDKVEVGLGPGDRSELQTLRRSLVREYPPPGKGTSP